MLKFFLAGCLIVSALAGRSQTAVSLEAQDTRNTGTIPSTYSSVMQLHYKLSGAIGLPSTSYHNAVIGLRAWSDQTGGKAHELAFTDDNQTYFRSGYTSSWDAWRRVLLEDQNGSIFPSNHIYMAGNLYLTNYTNFLNLGDDSQYPYGYARIGHGNGNNALIYHHQVASGPTLKINLDGYNFSPGIYAYGSGAYVNTGLFNVEYTHLNYAYQTVGYKAFLNMNNTNPGGSIVGFRSDVSTIAGDAIGSSLNTTTTGTCNAYGLIINATSSAGATGQVYGVVVSSGKSYFADKVGIGTATPTNQLVVGNNGQGLEFSANGGINNKPLFQSYDRNTNQYIDVTHYAKDFHFFNGASYEAFTIKDGKVGIGTTTPQSELAVKGIITTKKLVVSQTGWADYVFDKNYPLLPLQVVEEYIKKHKHLPGVPSAKQVENEGLDVGDNQAILLKKIEELTLYMIELKKELSEQQKKIRDLESKSNIK